MSYLHISSQRPQWMRGAPRLCALGPACSHPADGNRARLLPAPVSIILMTAPIILPPLKAAGFDLIWSA